MGEHGSAAGRRSDQLHELVERSVIDPSAPDPKDRRALIAEMLELGATTDEVAEHAHDLGDLATDLRVRTRADMVSLEQAAAAAEVDLVDALAVWRALGFHEADPRAPSLTPGEADLLALQRDMARLLGHDVALQILRTMSTAMARVAQAERDALRIRFEVPQLSSGIGYAEIMREYWRLIDEVLPRVDAAVIAVHRRQISMTARQEWAVDDEGTATTTRVAVGFADLVGFTERSAGLSSSALADALAAFDVLVHDTAHAHGSHVVKLIGDEVMFAAEDPEAAAATARALAAHDGSLLPALRVGVAWGEVLAWDGDYFGPVVNLASRLVAEAAVGGVLVSGALAAALDAGDGRIEAVPPMRVKGFDEPQPVCRLLA